MQNNDYVWWIDERRPNTSALHDNRFLLYGPYPDEETAARKVADLKKLPRYANSDLVLSKLFGVSELMRTSH
jgi:hypothetical protein